MMDRELVKAEYEYRWQTCEIDPSMNNSAFYVVSHIKSNKSLYEAASALANGIPWYMIAAVHWREASGDFTKNLVNGESWRLVTTLVPKGLGPWESWVAAAADALKPSQPFEVSIGGVFFALEAHNGLGYRIYHPDVPNPYIYSGTQFYSKGKYASDGKFDPELVDKQLGCMAILKALENKGEVLFGNTNTA